jgi:wyosine [tRNA(Phe)-imidazoG37] synthetase (radical SAM superfamily)
VGGDNRTGHVFESTEGSLQLMAGRMPYKHLFGPVPSRRLGMSLGVDLVPLKICTLDCVYCEVGRTTDLTLERRPYIPVDEVKTELLCYFSNDPDPDFVTFSGSGEPTLNSGIGEVIRFIKTERPDLSVAVLTNGTLLDDPKVRDALAHADVVLPSLDAATEPVFRMINRPQKDLNLKTYLDGLITFGKEFKGKIWLEVFILPGYNDSHDELDALKSVIEGIKPDSVQLNTLDRPGTVAGLRRASNDQLEHIVKYWNLGNVEIIASSPDRRHIGSFREDLESTIVATISRRPCTLNDLVEILDVHRSEINKYLDVLEAEHRIETIRAERGIFYHIHRK